MAQQFMPGGGHENSVTISVRASRDYAVVNAPYSGKHKKPQDPESLHRRKLRWMQRNGKR